MLERYVMRQMVVQQTDASRPNKFFADRLSTGDVGVEYYVAKWGITYSYPAISRHFTERSSFRAALVPDIDRPWLEDETTEVANECLRRQGAVHILGDLGAGKSTVLYGLRSLLRAAAVPYVYINGHFTNQSDRTAAAIWRTTRLGGMGAPEDYPLLPEY